VCPVTEPRDTIHQNAQKNYLPEGAGWIDFWTGEPLKGGQEITRNTPIDILPLYVKAGSIVPLGPFLQYAAEKKPAEMEIRIYPGADGSFTLYEDENDNYDYEKGVFATISLTWNDQLKELTIGERKGAYPGMLQNKVFNIIMVGRNKGTGPAIPLKFNKTVKYNGKAISVKM